ncbi:MAG: Eco57I restriction-modification methylase domain-containing protein [Hafniaceae bacterium]|uniref:Eco57I restriction-modification methylase domain-containing protein n=1 Tax=Lacticaseibacillus paracasei TaxID=1597 RepID=UPI001F026B5E|nr:Eco57I restriction-modification methylase domain-containing protein [Lacticaseibacillus paracasei]MDN5985875.1 Eco57I restriction-modification methylase domain-containing protein [Hafniaceae bacterium]
MGQFTTPMPVAEYMAERLIDDADVSINQSVKLLDPGAGTGVLGLAVVEKLFSKYPKCKIKLVVYENEPIALRVLKSNLSLAKSWSAESGLDFSYEIRERNYILEEEGTLEDGVFSFESNYDLVIANPPYKKLSKDSLEADAMNFVVHGAPNLYGFFWAKSAIELRQNATSVFIVPRSWMSGAYFERLRAFVFAQGSIVELHAFDNRNNVFGSTKVLQELVIVVFKKKRVDSVQIWSHDNITSLEQSESILVPRGLVVVGDEQRVYLITNAHQLALAKWAVALPSTFLDSGLKMKTGLTVCFRNRDLVEDEPSANNVPIFYADDFYGHEIRLKRESSQYLSKKRAGLLQDNVDYIFVKRFSTKEESRRIQTAYYEAERFSDEKQISTDNKLNFVVASSSDLLKGAFLVMSSTIFDEYYRLLSGNTQVNLTEINSMKFPDKHSLATLGKKYTISELTRMTQERIDQIMLTNFGGES